MSHGIRWIPAKLGLGQAAPVSAPAPVARPVNNEDSQTLMNGIVYGGLVLAGLAVLWAITIGATPQND